MLNYMSPAGGYFGGETPKFCRLSQLLYIGIVR